MPILPQRPITRCKYRCLIGPRVRTNFQKHLPTKSIDPKVWYIKNKNLIITLYKWL